MKLNEKFTLQKPPSLLDFVFEPAESKSTGNDHVEDGNKEKAEQIREKSYRVPVSQISDGAISSSVRKRTSFNHLPELTSKTIRPAAAEIPSVAQQIEKDADEQIETPIPELLGSATISESSPARVLRSPPTIARRFRTVRPELFHAILPISKRQQKMVIRNVEKIAEKIQTINSAGSLFIFSDHHQRYQVAVKRKPSKSPTGLDELIFKISTKKNDYTCSTEVQMRRLAFSNFAHFVDFWDPWVAVHEDEIDGRFHTNSEFLISREKGISPKFHGKVTTAAYDVKTCGTFPILDKESIFLYGLETGVKKIDLPKTFSPFISNTKDHQPQIHYLSTETWVTFFRNGSFALETSATDGNELFTDDPELPFYIIGDEHARIHLKGTVKGKALVFSETDIIIDDDLTYSIDPRIDSHADDYLGIVSLKDVKIAHPSVTGDGDLHIHAAIYARHRFNIPNRSKTGKATLFIYGSLSAGSLTATEPRYATHIEFDQRFDTRRPPNFPMTERYEIVEWDKRWIMEELEKADILQ